jgi:hypothetical protein
MMDQLLDTADDDLSRAAMDPLAALRVKCQTLTTALRISLLALSCHGQKEDFARQIAQNIDTIIAIKDKWNGQASQEDSGQAAIQSLIEESQQESQQGNP